jgi:hypothetical protein
VVKKREKRRKQRKTEERQRERKDKERGKTKRERKDKEREKRQRERKGIKRKYKETSIQTYKHTNQQNLLPGREDMVEVDEESEIGGGIGGPMW